MFCLPILLLWSLDDRGMASVIAGKVVDAESRGPLQGANVVIVGTTRGMATGPDGGFSLDLTEAGAHTLRFTLLGYATLDTTVTLEEGDSLALTIELVEEHLEEEVVVITGTRTLRSVADVPVRVEVIPEEEVEEKLLMTPSNVAMLLNESAGMRVQTTSASSGGSNLRIYGQSGSYTQILNDGVPTFSGMSAGFGLTQLLPLDLRQVEVIKGATSSLYGSDAIAGVVNFIPKTPGERGETSLLANMTTQEGFDAAGFHSGSIGETGVSILLSHNRQGTWDTDDDGFADVSKFIRSTITPRILHHFDEDVTLRLGMTYMDEDRLGGATEDFAGDNLVAYQERIDNTRWEASGTLDARIDDGQSFSVRLAALGSERDATYGTNPFAGVQRTFFTDAQYNLQLDVHRILLGWSMRTDEFEDRTSESTPDYSYDYLVSSLILQDEMEISPAVTLLLGGRVDFHDVYGTIGVPRASLMVRPGGSLTLRLGAGAGYRAPTIFVEEAEEVGFRNVRPLEGVEMEKARSVSFDANWSAIAGEVTFDCNAALFGSVLDDALIADPVSLDSGIVRIVNADGERRSTGGEVTLRTSWEHFKFYAGYTYLYSEQSDGGVTAEVELNPRHALGLVLMYEDHEGQLKIGLENYWTGRQKVERNPWRDVTPEYWITGLIAEKGFGAVRCFVNFENIFDTRQTKFEPIWVGDLAGGNIRTLPVYAPLEGRVINGGIRFVMAD